MQSVEKLRKPKGRELKKCFKRNEEERKKKYNKRVLQVENGSFMPLVISTNGGKVKECQIFYKRLSEMVAEKRNISISTAANFIGSKISFSFLKSALLCLRESRLIKKDHQINDMHLSNVRSKIQEFA